MLVNRPEVDSIFVRSVQPDHLLESEAFGGPGLVLPLEKRRAIRERAAAAAAAVEAGQGQETPEAGTEAEPSGEAEGAAADGEADSGADAGTGD